MKGYEFVQKRNILFYWVFIDIREDSQGRLRKHYINKEADGYIYPDGKRDPTFFIDNLEMIKKQMEYFDLHRYDLEVRAQEEGWQLALMLDTYRVHQLDVDDASFEEEFRALEEVLPFYKSINKKLPHFFFTTDTVFHGNSFTSYEDGCFDILHGNGSLIDPNTPIFNYDKDFSFPNFDKFISNYIQGEAKQRRVVDKDNHVSYTDTMETTDLQKLIDLISPDRAVDYKSWVSIGMAIKYNDPDNGLDVFRSFSQKCPEKYDRVECERKWDEFRPNGTITVGTLHYLARKDNEEEYNILFGKTYSRVKKQFEKTHFKLLNPIGYCEVNEEGIIFREENKMFQAYRNLWCYVNDPKNPYQNFFKKWIQDENIRTYEKLVFEPYPHYHISQNNTRFFNTFQHYKVYDICKNHQYNPVKGEAGLKIIQQQLRYMSGNEKTEEVFRYNSMWFAQIIQFPEQKGITALVFKSRQGTGKTSFFDYIGECILGSHLYYLTDKFHELFGEFTPNIQNKLLLVYDEPKGKDTFENADTLKASITRQKVTINKKHVSQEHVRDYARFGFCSNNLSPIKKEEDDRRYMCNRCSDEKASNTEYFNMIDSVTDFRHNFKNPCKDTLWAVFQWLINMDISNFDPINDRSKTSYNNRMITINPILSFSVYLFQKDKLKNDELLYEKQQLYFLYNEWMRENMPQSKMEHFNTFCKKLAEYDDFIQQFGRQKKKVKLHYSKLISSHPEVIQFFSLDQEGEDDDTTDGEEESDD